MPISFACPCGKTYTVDDALAGKKTKCPVCTAALVVPPPPAPAEELGDFEVLEDDEDEVVEDFEYVEDEPAVAAGKKDEGFGPDEVSEYTLAYESSMGGVTAYRVVRVGKELLFLDAGPFFKGLSSAASASEALDRGSQSGGQLGGASGSLAGGLLAGAIAGAVAGLDELKQAKAEKRREQLDKMSPKMLREEADSGKINFRAKADDLSDVRFDYTSFFATA